MIGEYLFAWQLPLFALFLGGWLIGGTYLARRALERWTDLPRRKRSRGAAAKLNFLATGMGLMALAAVAGLFFVLARKIDPPNNWRMLGAAVAAPLAMLGMAWAVVQVMLPLPAKTTARITALMSGATLLLLAVVITGAAVPARFQRMRNLRLQRCHDHLSQIYQALHNYEDRNPGEQAPDLQTLADDGLLEPNHLKCPAQPDREIGYLYAPLSVELFRLRHQGDEESNRVLTRAIVACDRKGNHAGVREVLFANGVVTDLQPEEFQEYLKAKDPKTGQPLNAAIAKLVAAER